MKIAICLYGQPRNYKLGYENINNFIKKNNLDNPDFFIHVWKLENNEKYQYSPWRNINANDLIVKNNEIIIEDLIKLYNPIKYEYENSINEFDKKIYNNSIIYNNTLYNSKKINNIDNTLSQIYSKNKVRNLLYNYTSENHKEYDMVIMTRIDYETTINFVLDNTINRNKVYVSNIHVPRKILPDNFIVCSFNKFMNMFNIYENLFNIVNNNDLQNKFKNINERFCINAEELLLANYLYFYNLDDIIYTKYIGFAFKR